MGVAIGGGCCGSGSGDGPREHQRLVTHLKLSDAKAAPSTMPASTSNVDKSLNQLIREGQAKGDQDLLQHAGRANAQRAADHSWIPEGQHEEAMETVTSHLSHSSKGRDWLIAGAAPAATPAASPAAPPPNMQPGLRLLPKQSSCCAAKDARPQPTAAAKASSSNSHPNSSSTMPRASFGPRTI